MPLDFRSSLLTTFNTPWDKYRWLRMPFGLKVSGDVFQERLDRVLRLIPGVLGITDDIVIHGATENTHDGRVLVLCKTARLNNPSLNSKKMQFKYTDCKFFGHRLTLDGIKVDPGADSAKDEHGPCYQPVGLGALSSQSMLVLMITFRFYVFSTSHC